MAKTDRNVFSLRSVFEYGYRYFVNCNLKKLHLAGHVIIFN